MTTLIINRNNKTGAIAFSGEISPEDEQRALTSKLGSVLLRKCNTPGATTSDWLLALEFIFRAAEHAKGVADVGGADALMDYPGALPVTSRSLANAEQHAEGGRLAP